MTTFDDGCDEHGIHGAQKEALHHHITGTRDGDAAKNPEEWELARQEMGMGATPEQLQNLQRVAADFLTQKASDLVNAWWSMVKTEDLPPPLGLAKLVLQVLTELVNCAVAFYSQGYIDGKAGDPPVLPSGHVLEIGLVEMDETAPGEADTFSPTDGLMKTLETEGTIRACPDCGNLMIQVGPGEWRHLKSFSFDGQDRPANPEEVSEWLAKTLRQIGKAPLN